MATLISTILAGLLQTKVYYHDIYCLFTWRISKHCVSFDPRVVHLGSLIMCLEQVCEQDLAFGLLLLTGAFSKVLLRYIPGEVYFLASNYKKSAHYPRQIMEFPHWVQGGSKVTCIFIKNLCYVVLLVVMNWSEKMSLKHSVPGWWTLITAPFIGF